MPGMPVRRKMIADIRAAGGLEAVVFDELRNGETLNSIAKTFDVGRSVLWRYLKKDPDRYAKYEQASKDGAAGMADKGQELLEQAADHTKGEPSAYVQAARNRAQYLQWHAGVMDRQTFGAPDKSPQVTVSIEHLHLGALQALGSPESQQTIEVIVQPVPVLPLPLEGKDGDD